MICFSLVAPVAMRAAEPPIELGSRRELFVDQHVIAKLDRTRLHMNEPRDEGVVLKFDQPWEGIHFAFVSSDGSSWKKLLQDPVIPRKAPFKFANRTLRLRFVMKDADLFAFQFVK